MPATPTLLAGRYRLGESLGRGGMGQVWLARDQILDRDVAIKEIALPDDLLAEDREVVQRRTLREARAAARLSHPHVVQVYDVLEADDRTWIVMEHVPSRSLQDVLNAHGTIDPARAARIGLGLLAALTAAHRAGVWHRDVKPSNVLLGEDGRVVLSDFGIATIEGDTLVTGSGLVIGSPEYMPPERARTGTAGPAADLWSLGATLYAAVEGRSPYRRGSVLGTLTALASEEPDPPKQAGVLGPVLDGLLRTNPAERIDFAETRRRLLAAAGEPAEGAHGAGAAPVPRRSPENTVAAPRADAGKPPARPAAAAAAPPGAAAPARARAAASPSAGIAPSATPSPAAAAPAGAAPSPSPGIAAAAPPSPAAAAPGGVAAAAPAAGSAASAQADAGASLPSRAATAPAPPAERPPQSPGAPPPARTAAPSASVPGDKSSDVADRPAVGRSPAPPVGGPSSPAPRRRRLALALIAVVVALAVATAGWFVLRPDPDTSARGTQSDGTPARTATTPSAGAPSGAAAPGGSAAPGAPGAPGGSAAPGGSGAPGGSAAPAATGGTGTTPQRPALPAGWREHRDRTGFSVYVPASWRESRKGRMVYFRPASGGRVLGIDQTDRPKSNPVADWRGQADYRVGRGDFPGYDEIKIVSVPYWLKAADWEFTFDGSNRRHVNNRGFVVSKNQAYGIWWETSDADWDEARDDLQLVFDSFRPAQD